MLFSSNNFGSGQGVCFGLSRPDPRRSARDQDGTGTDRDGPHLGTWTGRNAVNKAHGEFGRDRFGPGMGPGRAQDRTQARVWMAPPETATDL